jgi:glutamate synthase (NADPH/NADH) small chain
MMNGLGFMKVPTPLLTGRVGIVGVGLTAVDIAELAVREYGASVIMPKGDL